MPSTLSNLLSRRPLTGYFVMCFALSWSWMAVTLGVLGRPMMGFAGTMATFVGPTLSALVMTAVTEGRAGVRALLQRLVLWRVAPVWYAVVLLGWPALLVLAALTRPEALVTLSVPTAALAATYLFILVCGGPLGEEPGWRGYALPRLQERLTPLGGSLVLGALHGLWHLPIYLLVPGYNGAPADVPGRGLAFATFVGGVTAGAVVFTWIYNNTHGSILLAVLYRATGNSLGVLAHELLPGLDVRDLLQARPIAEIVLALLVIAVTRGRLNHDRLRPEPGDRVIRVRP
ncbi:CPBP family intramembrane glutamic endopeptidase [Nonomuraea sp. SYSU D8015]|uniref:CPBP family intramembrane glutamic endopeptidase n=1 Tax=Nonomuraea sp. SYSU D8015 TaxID=2593644 RepID=UPI001660D516|nr:CPBP family intramembrane glutamic endopeptidase [Nonomuraea sp. SYSU D8015]